MDVMTDLLADWGSAWIHLLIQPYYYIAVLFVILYFRRQIALERKLVHVKLHSLGSELWRAVWSGAVLGLAVSVLAVLLGVTVSGTAVACIWVVSLLLMLIRVRYLCFAYTIGILGVVQLILSWLPDSLQSGQGGEIVTAILDMDIPALLALAALLHLAEALLARWQGPGLASPLFLDGKRGKVVGGYRLEGFWPLPLFLLIPAGTGVEHLPWQPLLGGGLGLVSLPVLIGFSETTHSRLPARKAAATAGQLLIYSIVLLGLALLAHWWSPLTVLAALAALGLHEGIRLYSGLVEQGSSPLFVHPPSGLKVLAVLPGSPAEELGIAPGEVVLKVNGVALTTAAQLHEALRLNAAYCKLEVQNLEGESKFLQRPIYEGEHHQLGMILAPEPDTGVTAAAKPASILEIITAKTGTHRRGAGTSGGELKRPKPGGKRGTAEM